MSDSKWLGMYRALVIDNNDPERRGRIRVQCPTVLGTYLSAWCEPCIPYATDFAGDYYVPPIGEGIWVQFENGDIDKPIWNGGWYRINSSPLTQNSSPEDYRYMTFKNSVLRMGEREFIFELRQTAEDKSVQFEISPSTVLGLSYIGSKTEEELSTLEEYILNKKIIFEDYPDNIVSLDKNKLDISVFQEFIENEYNKTKEDISYTLDNITKIIGDNETPDSILHSLKEISEAINSINTTLERVEKKVDDLRRDFDWLNNDWRVKWCESEIKNAWNHIGTLERVTNENVDDLNWNAAQFDSFPAELLPNYLRRIDKV